MIWLDTCLPQTCDIHKVSSASKSTISAIRRIVVFFIALRALIQKLQKSNRIPPLVKNEFSGDMCGLAGVHPLIPFVTSYGGNSDYA